MSLVSNLSTGLFCALSLACLGCSDLPGHPGPSPEVPRPEQVLEFKVLYQQNCAGCHGEDGKNGMAIPLANPIYLAIAGEKNVHHIIANGVSGKLMPAFDKSAGGTLTGQQIDSLVQGMLQKWGQPDVLSGVNTPPYSANVQGDAAQGLKTYAEFCERCHGAEGRGVKEPTAQKPDTISGSIVDPSYLALVSDQTLRTLIIAGRPDQRMPDWRSDISGAGAHAMTDQEITDVVAWLAAQRTPAQQDALKLSPQRGDL